MWVSVTLLGVLLYFIADIFNLFLIFLSFCTNKIFFYIIFVLCFFFLHGFILWLVQTSDLQIIITSSPKGKDRSPESNVPRSNVVFSTIEANHSKVNSPETLHYFPPVKCRSQWSTFIFRSNVRSYWTIIANCHAYSTNNLQDIRQNHWTMKYRSKWSTFILRSNVRSYWIVVPNCHVYT